MKTRPAPVFPEIHLRSLYLDEKPHRFVLTQPVVVLLSSGEPILIPTGYVTDFASVPRLLRGIVATVGNHNLAVLIHDWLYDNKVYNRLWADQEMLYWLRRCGVSEIKCQLMYWAVRLGGRSWWHR